MAKVHPNVAVPKSPARAAAVEEEQQSTVPTVWRNSLLVNYDGFTVFDGSVGLAFRVDRYGSSSGTRRRRRVEDIVLMDAARKPLLTVRRNIKLSSSLAGHWVVYDGDASASGAKPLLLVRRHHAGLHRQAADKTLAHVTPLGPFADAAAAYVLEGSYGRWSCAVREARGNGGAAAVAEVRRKESVGDDVFRLVVPDHRVGAALSMGAVISLDQMFGGASSQALSLLPRSWSA